MSSPKSRVVRSLPPLRHSLGPASEQRFVLALTMSLLEPCTSRPSKPATSVCIRPTGCDHCALPPSACDGTYWSSVRVSELRPDLTDENVWWYDSKSPNRRTETAPTLLVS